MVFCVFISLSFNKCTGFAVHTVMCHCLCVTLTKNAQLTPILSIHCSTWTWNNTYASNNISIFFFLVLFSVCAHFSSFVKIKKRHYDCPRYFLFLSIVQTWLLLLAEKMAIMIIVWVTSYVLIYIIRTCVPLIINQSSKFFVYA